MDESSSGHEYRDGRRSNANLDFLKVPQKQFCNRISVFSSAKWINIENHNPTSSLNFPNGSNRIFNKQKKSTSQHFQSSCKRICSDKSVSMNLRYGQATSPHTNHFIRIIIVIVFVIIVIVIFVMTLV